MKRRFLLSSLALLPFVSSVRAAPSWHAEILKGGFNGKVYEAGLHIVLEPGWKTYWRNPGEAGIPPEIKVAMDGNLQSIDIDLPLPKRIIDESGEALGYHDEVVFLLRLMPKDAAQPVALNLSAFFGVCEKICSPAKFEGSASFAPSDHGEDAALISQWRALIPEKMDFVKSASVENMQLHLQLAQPVSDIFIEGTDLYYFARPDLDASATNAVLKIAGIKNDADLKGIELRITADAGGRGIEQRITIS